MKYRRFLAIFLASLLVLSATLCSCSEDGDGDGVSDGVEWTDEGNVITQRVDAVEECNITKTPTVRADDLFVGRRLSEIALDGGEADREGVFVWKNDALTLRESGEYEIAFVPDDENVKIAYCKVSLVAKQLTVTVSCGENGEASLDGETPVDYGESIEVLFRASIGYAVSSLTVDGKTVEASASYTFEKITESHTICAEFAESELEIEVRCIEGSEGCFTQSGTTLTFSGISADSIYSISGEMIGNIVIDVGESYRFELEMTGLTLWSETDSPIKILSGDKVTLTAKKDSANILNDLREAVDENDENSHSGAIYAECDLEIGGKGSLEVLSENNNGIHTKDDLEIKNLTLGVSCEDNALKGNDSVCVKSGKIVLVSRTGDGIKTSNTDVSQKGNQRGVVELLGGEIEIYAATDGIDAAHDVIINESEGTLKLDIFTDKYSEHSEDVTVNEESGDSYYIRFTSDKYNYSFKWYNSESDYKWVNASYHSSVMGGRSTYYYYTIPIESGYGAFEFYMYSSDMEMGQDKEYLVSSDLITKNTAFDTFALSQRGGSLSYNWTNYSSSPSSPGGMGGPGGPGGMGGGNSEKSEYSTKGIKAGNAILIDGGEINIEAYDDAIHANADTVLENGQSPTGNISISGGRLTVSSNDDGIHADGELAISGGTIRINKSYEGLEGAYVLISGGNVSVQSTDDGINSPSNAQTGVRISGGRLYIHAGGDGIDTNSRASYSGIIFEGGQTVVISTSGGNSAIDTEQGYSFKGGEVLAIMPSGGMSNEATHCQSFSSVGTSARISIRDGESLEVRVGGETTVSVGLDGSMQAMAIYLGSKSASFASVESVTGTPDTNGVCWY